MTKEEAISKVKGYLTDYLPSDNYEEVEEIVKALEQENVLDKIRAEIEQRRQRYEVAMYYIDAARGQELSWVLEVIDKYKAEREDKE